MTAMSKLTFLGTRVTWNPVEICAEPPTPIQGFAGSGCSCVAVTKTRPLNAETKLWGTLNAF